MKYVHLSVYSTYFPIAQSVHAEDVALLNVPATQLVHVPALARVPAAHGVHVAAPDADT